MPDAGIFCRCEDTCYIDDGLCVKLAVDDAAVMRIVADDVCVSTA